MFGIKKDRSGQTEEKIETFSLVTLRENGMRGSTEYEAVMKGDEAEVSLYMIRYAQGGDHRELEKRAVCSKDAFVKLLNDCRVMSWNGFDGKHPKGVLDGIMFSFKAVVDSEKQISAHGSQNFPVHYSEFRNGLYDILDS